MDNLILSLDNKIKEIVIPVDLNCDLKKEHFDMPTKSLTSLYEMYQMSQLINEARRVTEQTATLIDHVVTNRPENISYSGVVHTGMSDHTLVFAIRKINIVKKEKQKTIEIRNMKKFNQELLITDLANQPWEYIYFSGKNPEQTWDIWKELFLEVLNIHAPIKHAPIPPIINELQMPDKTLKSAEEILNKFFTDIGRNLANHIGTSDCNYEEFITPSESEFKMFKPVTVDAIHYVLTSLATNKATGID